MFAATSKLVVIVAGAYLIVFFSLVSGVINGILEGQAMRNQFFIPSRSVQTVGESIVITTILFMGMIGAYMLFRAGKSATAKTQQALLAAGFILLGASLFIGFTLVDRKI